MRGKLLKLFAVVFEGLRYDLAAADRLDAVLTKSCRATIVKSSYPIDISQPFIYVSLTQQAHPVPMRETNSVPIHAQIWSTNRSSIRHKVERWSTLRASDGKPQDVTIDDLSLTGFRMSGADDMNQGDLIMVGLAGVGAREASVAWVGDGTAGCSFSSPITPLQFEMTISANTVVEADFGPYTPSAHEICESEGFRRTMSDRRALAIIFAAALAAWGVFIALGYAIAWLMGLA